MSTNNRYENKEIINNKIKMTFNEKKNFNTSTIENEKKHFEIDTMEGDRYDLMAHRFYQNHGLFWIIKKYNNIKDATMYVDTNKYPKLLIPRNIIPFLRNN